MNAASSHGVILPLAPHTHTNTLSRRCVVSCCCTCPPCATSRLRLKELAKSFVRRRALTTLPLDHHEQERLVTKRAPNSLPHLAGIALNYHNQDWTQMRPNWKLNCMKLDTSLSKSQLHVSTDPRRAAKMKIIDLVPRAQEHAIECGGDIHSSGSIQAPQKLQNQHRKT